MRSPRRIALTVLLLLASACSGSPDHAAPTSTQPVAFIPAHSAQTLTNSVGPKLETVTTPASTTSSTTSTTTAPAATTLAPPAPDTAPPPTAAPAPVPSIVAVSGETARDGYCTQYEGLLAALAPPGGWDVPQMSRYMWRESRCQPEVQSQTSDSGLLQVNQVNHAFLTNVLGEHVDRYTLLDPTLNIRAAAALCTYWRNAGAGCYAPWGG